MKGISGDEARETGREDDRDVCGDAREFGRDDDRDDGFDRIITGEDAADDGLELLRDNGRDPDGTGDVV